MASPRKSIFVETGTYQAPMLRTYQTKFNQDFIGDFNQAIQGGAVIERGAIAPIAGHILNPSTAPTATLNIDNGWNTRRMSFLIEIDIDIDEFDQTHRTVILTGYTDHDGDRTIQTGQFDPNMRLYFNSSAVITTVKTRDFDGTIRQRRNVKDSSHLIGRNVNLNINPIVTNQANGFGNYNNSISYATPYNVLVEMQRLNRQEMGMNNNSAIEIETRYRANNKNIIRSRRENTLPTSFLTNMFGRLTTSIATQNQDQGTYLDQNSAIADAASGLREFDKELDQAFYDIILQSNYLSTGFITWKELTDIYPQLLNNTQLFRNGNAYQMANSVPSEAGNFAHWNGMNFETLIANNVSQFVPALMTSCMIGSIQFSFDNNNPSGEPDVRVLGGRSLVDGIDFVDLVGVFVGRFKYEVVPMITHNNDSRVSLYVDSGIGTETLINVSYEGGPLTPYNTPTFCDSMFTPVIATDIQQLTNIAVDVGQFVANTHMLNAFH